MTIVPPLDPVLLHSCCKITTTGKLLFIKITPNAKNNSCEGAFELNQQSYLKLKIAAPATDQQANLALLNFLSQLLHVRPEQLKIVHGLRSKFKIIQLS